MHPWLRHFVVNYESEVRCIKFNMADPIWWTKNHESGQKFTLGVFDVADCEFKIICLKFKMAPVYISHLLVASTDVDLFECISPVVIVKPGWSFRTMKKCLLVSQSYHLLTGPGIYVTVLNTVRTCIFFSTTE